LKDPKCIALSSHFEDLVRKYQTTATTIICQLVTYHVTFYPEKLMLQLMKGIFHISKQGVISQSPQNKILGILQMAQQFGELAGFSLVNLMYTL
jgi:hypothetical protein